MRALALAAALTCAAAQQIYANTQYGQVMGEVINGVRVFRSIPFAAPPVGDLRFKQPAPPAKWNATRDVRGYPQPCAQLKVDGDIFYGAEDCLYLSVYQPEGPGPFPVMVFIYGGAYVLGDAEELGFYDGVNLAKAANVTLVAGNYRVGPFGFMALQGLQAEDPNHSTGNAALQDQVAALQWVQGNIANFNGDPNRVTIFGESAGAFSVCWQLVSPASRGLFHAAIMESGSCDTAQFYQSLDDAIAFNSLYATALGCNQTDPAAQVACMRGKSTNDMMRSIADWLNPNWPFVNSSGPLSEAHTAALGMMAKQGGVSGSAPMPALAPIMPWGPAIDGAYTGLLDVPLELMRKGAAARVPVILGTNANEGTIFVPMLPIIVPGASFPPSDADLPKFIAHMLDMFNPAVVANVSAAAIAQYPAPNPPDNFARGAEMLTHFFFACATRRTARALAAYGPTYLYQFSYKLRWPEALLFGDYHSSELNFVFRNEWPPIIHTFDADDTTVVNAFTAYWANFAHNPSGGDPNTGPFTPPQVWPAYDAVADVNMQFELPFSLTSGLDAAQCAFWDEAYTALTGNPSAQAEGAGGRVPSWLKERMQGST